MIYFGLLALGLGLGLGIAAIGAGIGQGIAANGALQGMARQPEAIPKIQRVAMLVNEDNPGFTKLQSMATSTAATQLGVGLEIVGVRQVPEFEGAITKLKRADALIILPDPLSIAEAEGLATLAFGRDCQQRWMRRFLRRSGVSWRTRPTTRNSIDAEPPAKSTSYSVEPRPPNCQSSSRRDMT